MSRAQLTSTVEQNTGGAVSPYVAGKNFLINGGFDIWQRGTSGLGAGYAADRWFLATSTASQDTTKVATGCQYSMKVTTSTTTAVAIYQSIETANSVALAGKTVTLSHNLAASTSTLVYYQIGYSTSDNVTPTGSFTTINSNSFTATTTMSAATPLTVAIPSTARTVWVNYYTGSLASGVSIFFSGMQLEIGSVATPFSRAGGTLSGELAACQRYYWQTAWNTSQATTIMVGGIGTGSTAVAQAYCAHPVTMRAIPSAALNGTANMVFYNGVGGGATYAISAITAQGSTTIAGTLNFTTSGTTANVIYNLLALTAGNCYISFSAEL